MKLVLVHLDLVKQINTIHTKKLKNQRFEELKDNDGDNYTIMTTIDRNQLIAEELIRTHVRKRIREKVSQKLTVERQMRSTIRKMILEVEAGSSEAPARSTGINVLANLLEKVVPIIEDDYKMLTTSDEQRESFKNHLVQAVKNALKPIDAAAPGQLPESYEFEINEDFLTEKITIDFSMYFFSFVRGGRQFLEPTRL